MRRPWHYLLIVLWFLRHIQAWTTHRSTKLFASTPFEANFYDNPYDDNNNQKPLAVDPATRLVLGVNKYSHDTALTAADAATGQVLWALERERISRRKHDAGGVGDLVEGCLSDLQLDLEAIDLVVGNNHHCRIAPIEANVGHMEWEAGLAMNYGAEVGYDDDYNTLPSIAKQEVSHHLAHAYSVAAQAPFDSGLVVVVDGMGESYRTMQLGRNDPSYTSDFDRNANVTCMPQDIAERLIAFDWREAESVYTFTKSSTSLDIVPLFKRFVEERSPPFYHNHGFENMDSVGAVYSRASSHIFGDWNACGKVMGLAPWIQQKWKGQQVSMPSAPIMSGSLHDGSFHVNRTLLEGTPLVARNDPDLFDSEGNRRKRYDFDDESRLPSQSAREAIALAARVQTDLETVLMDFVAHFKQATLAENLCVAGGVALNSVLNGRLARELGFAQTFIPPYPGDEGIALGCCAFGLFGKKQSAAVWKGILPVYLGPDPTELIIKAAIERAEPWIEVESIRNEDQRLEMMAKEIEAGGVVAWYHSRSECGPRALGHRSILADPRKKGLVRFINEKVKSRESFRPFAPSVLAEEASKWFDLGENVVGDNVSPFMSMTAFVHNDKRAKIPAVTHVDGSSRIQTVTKDAEQVYHKLIAKFFALTGVPMVLNTSFNTLPSEPIVESPQDAIRSFLYSLGAIEMLVMGDYVIKRKSPDLRKLLGEATKGGEMKVVPVCPIRTGPAEFESSFHLDEGPSADEEPPETSTKVRMPDRPMHGPKNEWFSLLDELEGELLSACDGTATMSDIMAFYTAMPEDQQLEQQDIDEAQVLLQNIVHRLVRLYEHTLIHW